MPGIETLRSEIASLWKSPGLRSKGYVMQLEGHYLRLIDVGSYLEPDQITEQEFNAYVKSRVPKMQFNDLDPVNLDPMGRKFVLHLMGDAGRQALRAIRQMDKEPGLCHVVLNDDNTITLEKDEIPEIVTIPVTIDDQATDLSIQGNQLQEIKTSENSLSTENETQEAMFRRVNSAIYRDFKPTFKDWNL